MASVRSLDLDLECGAVLAKTARSSEGVPLDAIERRRFAHGNPTTCQELRVYGAVAELFR
ncbi:MAG: hypothetical protein ACI8PT_000688 [Gammaproteobacteria bacterium]|jgi:hypothetical protein